MERTALYICVIVFLFQNVSCVYIDPSYDCIAPWARTFLAWREANTKIAGGLSPLFRNVPLNPKAICNSPLSSCSTGLAPNGGLAVTSASRGPPIGVSVLSENIIEGPLAVAGDLPFLGSVAMGGVLPTAGLGSVSYSSNGPNDALIAAKAGLLRYNRFGRFGFC